MNSSTQCLKRFFSAPGDDPQDCTTDQVGLFDHLEASFPPDSAHLRGLRGRTPLTPRDIQMWITRSTQRDVTSWGAMYAKAWATVRAQGDIVGARNLELEDMHEILEHIPGAIEDVEETRDIPRALSVMNPFYWEAHNLISHADKLQWRVRHTRAHATWKLMVRRVCYLRGDRGGQDMLSADKVAALERLDSRRLPVCAPFCKDARFMAFLSVNHFSRAPLVGTTSLVPFSNEEFIEYISMYMGTPSPATCSFVGAPVRRGNNPNFYTSADAAGLNLAKAALGRDGLRTIYHNDMLHAFVTEAALAGVKARTNQVINADVAVRVSRWTPEGTEGAAGIGSDEETSPRNRSTRRGSSSGRGIILPDLLINFHSKGGIPRRILAQMDGDAQPQGSSLLGDVKTISLTTNSPYCTHESFEHTWARYRDKRAHAVERRAAGGN